MKTLAFVLPVTCWVLAAWVVPENDPEIDYEHDLGLPVHDQVPLENPPDERALDRIGEIVGLDASSLAGLTFARGTVVTRRNGDVDSVLLSLPFDAGFRGGRLTLAVGDEGVAGAGLWGLPDFDEDPGLVWSRFLGELLNATRRASTPQLMPHDQLEQRLREVSQASGWTVSDLRAISKHRTLMRKVSMQLRQFTDFMNGRGPVDADWARGVADEVRAAAEVLLRRYGSELEEAELTKVSAEYERLAAFYDELPAKIEATEGLVPFLREHWDGGLCSRCHSTTTRAGVGWRDAVGSWRANLGLPAGVLRVGYDVTTASGDDGRRSQIVADRFRAAFLLAASPE